VAKIKLALWLVGGYRSDQNLSRTIKLTAYWMFGLFVIVKLVCGILLIFKLTLCSCEQESLDNLDSYSLRI
jgi:hypothetical protein